MNLSKNVNIVRVMNAVAAGTGDTQDSSVLDMSGYDGVVFVAAFGTLTTNAVTDIRAQQGQASNLSDAADLAGTKVSLADTDGNKVAVLDVYRPQERYVRCRVTRATANAVIDGIIAIQYSGSKAPITQGSTVAGIETHISPAEGTA